MSKSKPISAINKVLESYFEKHPRSGPVPAKDLMPRFIAAGIFPADQENGLPIRRILRQLDKAKQLYLIPYVLAERKQKNTFWYFASKESNIFAPKISKQKNQTTCKEPSRKLSDEGYVIDLCDEILGTKASRQHTFDFLLGDKSSNGRQRRLPVDAYYSELNLVIEYREIQHTKPVSHFDKPHITTVSGVHRGEQRRIYDQRRRDILPKYGIKLVELTFSIFKHSANGRIIRDEVSDKSIIKKVLRSEKINIV